MTVKKKKKAKQEDEIILYVVRNPEGRYFFNDNIHHWKWVRLFKSASVFKTRKAAQAVVSWFKGKAGAYYGKVVAVEKVVARLDNLDTAKQILSNYKKKLQQLSNSICQHKLVKDSIKYLKTLTARNNELKARGYRLNKEGNLEKIKQ